MSIRLVLWGQRSALYILCSWYRGSFVRNEIGRKAPLPLSLANLLSPCHVIKVKSFSTFIYAIFFAAQATTETERVLIFSMQTWQFAASCFLISLSAKEASNGCICIWRGWRWRSSDTTYSGRPPVPLYGLISFIYWPSFYREGYQVHVLVFHWKKES